MSHLSWDVPHPIILLNYDKNKFPFHDLSRPERVVRDDSPVMVKVRFGLGNSFGLNYYNPNDPFYKSKKGSRKDFS